jgi:hypothetical protein
VSDWPSHCKFIYCYLLYIDRQTPGEQTFSSKLLDRHSSKLLETRYFLYTQKLTTILIYPTPLSPNEYPQRLRFTTRQSDPHCPDTPANSSCTSPPYHCTPHQLPKISSPETEKTKDSLGNKPPTQEMPPLEPLDPDFRTRKTQQHLGHKRLHLLSLLVRQSLRSIFN